MSEELFQILSLDVPAVLTAACCAVSCALLGNFLVLRRMSMMGDAISHAVLPGIVLAFFFTGTRSAWPVFVGAAIAGILTAVLVEVVKRAGRVNYGAAMGVVFSILFALGVLLMEQAAARSVDLDADCLLHGQLESVFWFPPRDLVTLISWSTLALLPQALSVSFFVMLVVLVTLKLFFKELTLAAFDPGLASALGFRASLLHYLLMVLVAIAVVASFQAVGSILVIAMLICPAAISRLLTDRLRRQFALSVIFAVAAVVLGYVTAVFLPEQLGLGHALSAAGMITVMLGLFLGIAVVFAPHYGLISTALRRRRVARHVAMESGLNT